MTSTISKEIADATMEGVKAIAMSLATQDQLTDLPKLKENLDTQTGRDNYCKTALLLWGMLDWHLQQVDDTMFNRILVFSLSILNPVLNRDEFKPYFVGVDLNRKPGGGDHSNLCYEMHSWFNRNDTLPGIDSMTTTGKHLFALLALKGQLTEERINKFYEMGSLLQKNTNGMGVMKSILMNNKIKFNF